MITRIVKMHFHPHSAAQFIELIEERNDRIAAQAGCLALSLLRDKDDPCLFFTYSIWDSIDSLETYRRSPFFKETWTLVKRLFAHPAEAWTTASIYQSAN